MLQWINLRCSEVLYVNVILSFILYSFQFRNLCGSSHAPFPKNHIVIDEDAIRQLSEVFDVGNLKLPTDNRTENDNDGDYSEEIEGESRKRRDYPYVQRTSTVPVPAYMLNLYNTIADRNGVMRIPNPFNANLIKSFPNKRSEPDHLQFDLSSVSQERLLQAELHLQFRPRADPKCQTNTSPNAQIKQSVNIYKLLSPVSNPTAHNANDRETVSQTTIEYSTFPTTQIIPIKPAVQDWIDKPDENYGLYIAITNDETDGFKQACALEISFEAENVPSLVVYLDDGRPDRNPKYRIKSIRKQSEYLRLRSERLKQPELIQGYKDSPQKLLVEISEDPSDQTARIRRSSSSLQPGKAKLAFSRTIKSRKKFSAERDGKSTGTFSYKPRAKPRGPCRRHDLYVSFEDIGWSSWIISPKGFQAFHCRGDCRFPIGQESKPSNHATVISIINHMKFHKRVSAPCCVPDKLYSISLLYFDNQQNVILKQYDDMVAQSCACR